MTTPGTLTVALAAKHAGVSSSTIRRWMDSGNLTYSTTAEGWRTVRQDDLLAYLSRQGTTPHRAVTGATSRQVPTPSMAPHHETQSDALKIALTSLEHERRVNEELRTRIKDFEKERTQHLAEMRALLNGKNEGLLSIKRWLGK